MLSSNSGTDLAFDDVYFTSEDIVALPNLNTSKSSLIVKSNKLKKRTILNPDTDLPNHDYFEDLHPSKFIRSQRKNSNSSEKNFELMESKPIFKEKNKSESQKSLILNNIPKNFFLASPTNEQSPFLKTLKCYPSLRTSLRNILDMNESPIEKAIIFDDEFLRQKEKAYLTTGQTNDTKIFFNTPPTKKQTFASKYRRSRFKTTISRDPDIRDNEFLPIEYSIDAKKPSYKPKSLSNSYRKRLFANFEDLINKQFPTK